MRNQSLPVSIIDDMYTTVGLNKMYFGDVQQHTALTSPTRHNTAGDVTLLLLRQSEKRPWTVNTLPAHLFDGQTDVITHCWNARLL